MSEKLKVAFIAPLTGDQAVVGIPMMKAAELAVRDSGFDIEIIGFDDRAEMNIAKDIAKKIVEQKDIIAVIGNKNSGPLEVAGDIYSSAGITFITPSATNYELSQKGWKGFFRLCADDRTQSRSAAEFAVQQLKLKNMYILHDDTSYGKPLGIEFKNYAENLGAKVAMVKIVPVGVKDVKDIVKDIKESGTDCIYLALTEIESSIIAVELEKQNVKTVVLGADGSPNSKFPEIAGKSAEGAYMTYAGAVLGQTEEAKHFKNNYELKYGKCPVYAAEVYDSTMLIIQAIKNMKEPEREKVSQIIRNILPYNGISGLINFNEYGNRVNQNVSIWKVIYGEMVLVK